ncbi:MAG: DUF3105 domain-containing protein [Marmoricola sp.]
MAKTRETGGERRARLDQIRKEQESAERRRRLLGVTVLAVVLALLVVAVILGLRGSKDQAPAANADQIIPADVGATPVTKQPEPATVSNPTDIKGVVAYDTAGYPGPGKADAGTLTHNHVAGTVEYAVTPPVGGDHNGVWMNAGVYTKPVPSERAVHDLEHGAVWITYQPTLPAKEVAQLRAFVDKQSLIDEGDNANRFIVMSPWADGTLPSPIVLSSWGYQLQVDSPTDSRLQDFVDTFRHNQTYTPEFGSSVDGIPVQTGGIPAYDGAKLANPAGKVNGQGM